MKRTVMMALVVVAGCATGASPSPNTLAGGQTPVQPVQQPPSTITAEARSTYAEANEILMSTAGKPADAISQAHAKALTGLDRALALNPDFMDALNDKAWILATSPDESLRKPKEALEMAKRALDSIARAGMLRKNREAFADDHTTGRMIVAATTFAAALAANGVFTPGDTQEQMVSADCIAAADPVMSFVVESAVSVDQKFHTPSTADMVKRARDFQATFRQRKPLIGEVPLSSLMTPATRLR
jgi:hypothetical protein